MRLTNNIISIADIGELDKGRVNCRVLQRQARETVFIVYFVRLHEQTARLIEEGKCYITTLQEKTVVACSQSLHYTRIISEDNKCNEALKSPMGGKKRRKMDKFETNVCF